VLLGFLVGTLEGDTVAQPVLELEDVTVVRYCAVMVMTSDPPGGKVKSTAVGAALNWRPPARARLGAVGA
jgi:hypothetical protein